jgi:hypothetical protein
LSSPAWLAQPIITSSTLDGSRFGFLSSKDFIASAAKSSARTAESVPPKLPMGVRVPETMYEDFIYSIFNTRQSKRASLTLNQNFYISLQKNDKLRFPKKKMSRCLMKSTSQKSTSIFSHNALTIGATHLNHQIK